MIRLWPVPLIVFSGCAAFTDPDPTNLQTYCTADTGFRAGYLSKAYYGVCPKETEGAFLAGLQRGRAYRPSPPQALPYYQRIEQTEKQLLAATSEPDRERLKVQGVLRRLSEGDRGRVPCGAAARPCLSSEPAAGAALLPAHRADREAAVGRHVRTRPRAAEGAATRCRMVGDPYRQLLVLVRDRRQRHPVGRLHE